MTEGDYTVLLETVEIAMRQSDAQDVVFVNAPPLAPPLAANDNGLEWPLVPFPDGWEASC